MSTHDNQISATDNHAESAGPAKPETPSRSRRGRIRILIALGVLAVVAASISGYWYFFMRGLVFSDDARLNGHLVDMAPDINGRLTDVFVREGDFVKKGDKLFQMDSGVQEAALNQAKASLKAAIANETVCQAVLNRAMNGSRPEEIGAAQATADRMKKEEDLARTEYERTKGLATSGAMTEDDLTRAQNAFETATLDRKCAEQNLALLQNGTRQEDKDAAKANVDLATEQVAAAEAAVKKAQTDLEHCLISAPFDGWVVRRWLDPGALPIIGQPVVSLFDPSTLRVDANIEEKDLHSVAIGDEVDITVDAYPDLHLKGRVYEILRATNSQFSLIPAEGVSGTYIKVTQRVPLRIAITEPDGLRLGPGLSAEVHIRSGSAARQNAEAGK